MQQKPVKGSFWAAVQKEKNAQIREEAAQNFHTEIKRRHPVFFSALAELEDKGYDICIAQKIFDVVEENNSYNVGLEINVTSPKGSAIKINFMPEGKAEERIRSGSAYLGQPLCEIRPLDAKTLLKLNPDIDTIHGHVNSAAYDTFRATHPENVMFLFESAIAQVERHDEAAPKTSPPVFGHLDMPGHG